MEHHEIPKLLTSSAVSKFITKNGLKEIFCQVVNVLIAKM